MVTINSSVLFRFRTALVYNDTKYSVNFMTLWSSTVCVNLLNGGDLAYRIALMNILLSEIRFWFNMIWYIFVNCNWVDTRWQQYSTHSHTNNTQNTTKQTIHWTTQKFGRLRAMPRLLWVLPWLLPYNWEKSTENPFYNLMFMGPCIIFVVE